MFLLKNPSLIRAEPRIFFNPKSVPGGPHSCLLTTLAFLAMHCVAYPATYPSTLSVPLPPCWNGGGLSLQSLFIRDRRQPPVTTSSHPKGKHIQCRSPSIRSVSQTNGLFTYIFFKFKIMFSSFIFCLPSHNMQKSITRVQQHLCATSIKVNKKVVQYRMATVEA